MATRRSGLRSRPCRWRMRNAGHSGRMPGVARGAIPSRSHRVCPPGSSFRPGARGSYKHLSAGVANATMKAQGIVQGLLRVLSARNLSGPGTSVPKRVCVRASGPCHGSAL